MFFYANELISTNSGSSSDDTLIIATRSPAAIQCISWNPQQVNATKTSVLNRLGIMENDETGIAPNHKTATTYIYLTQSISIRISHYHFI